MSEIFHLAVQMARDTFPRSIEAVADELAQKAAQDRETIYESLAEAVCNVGPNLQATLTDLLLERRDMTRLGEVVCYVLDQYLRDVALSRAERETGEDAQGYVSRFGHVQQAD